MKAFRRFVVLYDVTIGLITAFLAFIMATGMLVALALQPTEQGGRANILFTVFFTGSIVAFLLNVLSDALNTHWQDDV